MKEAVTIRSLAIAGGLVLLLGLGCDAGTGPPITEVVGTWGGKNAGLIATDTGAHVHIGCTFGNTKGPIRPDANGRFSIVGTYNVDAYPINLGIFHPARFTGRIVRRTMSLTVVLTDTTRQIGPVSLRFGDEPQMGVCPICRVGDKAMARAKPAMPAQSVPSGRQARGQDVERHPGRLRP